MSDAESQTLNLQIQDLRGKLEFMGTQQQSHITATNAAMSELRGDIRAVGVEGFGDLFGYVLNGVRATMIIFTAFWMKKWMFFSLHDRTELQLFQGIVNGGNGRGKRLHSWALVSANVHAHQQWFYGSHIHRWRHADRLLRPDRPHAGMAEERRQHGLHDEPASREDMVPGTEHPDGRKGDLPAGRIDVSTCWIY